MRVLHFFKTSYPSTSGGIEQVIHQLARGGKKVGIDTEVLSLASDKTQRSLELDGYVVHQARMNFQIASTGFSASAFTQFAQLAKKADVIHYHFPWPFMDVVHFLTRVDKPTVVTYHSDIIRQKQLLKLYRPLKRKFLNDVDSIITTSPNYLATSPVLERFADKVDVIPIGLDKDSYPSPSPELLAHWRNRVGNKFFLFVGVLRYYKGLHTLIKAAQNTDYPIVILGSGPIENQLKKQAAELGLNNIIFLGFQSDEDKVALLQLCYAVVLPSHLRSEAFGIFLLEGAMFGKPMISCEIGTGTTYINIANESGIVVPPNDSQALRNAMQFLWDNPETAKSMGDEGEKRYWELFSAERMVNSYAEIYQKVIKAHSSDLVLQD